MSIVPVMEYIRMKLSPGKSKSAWPVGGMHARFEARCTCIMVLNDVLYIMHVILLMFSTVISEDSISSLTLRRMINSYYGLITCS